MQQSEWPTEGGINGRPSNRCTSWIDTHCKETKGRGQVGAEDCMWTASDIVFIREQIWLDVKCPKVKQLCSND